MNRYHPRDLFDIKLLLENQGLTEAVRQAFIVYLTSGSRPMHELLEPRITEASQQEFENTFKNEFSGMTTTSVTHEALKDIRARLPRLLLDSFTENERMFLMHLKSGNPDWSLLPIDGIKNLPGIQWKLQNINKIHEEKKKEQLNKLKQVLEV